LRGALVGLGFGHAVGLQASKHDVPLEEDHRATVAGEPFPAALHLVDGHDAGQRYAKPVSGLLQVFLLEQAGRVGAGQGGKRLGAGDAIGDQADLELIGVHGGFGGVAEISIDVKTGAVMVELGLQLTHGQAARAVTECGHSWSAFFLNTFLAWARMNSTPSMPITPPKNGAVSCGIEKS